MLTDYIGIIKLVMLGLDILVALILLRFVITGLRRGFARNCFRLVLIVGLVLLFSVGFKPIIRSVINMPLPIDFDVYADEVTLVNIVETLVCDNMFEGDITALKEANISGLLTDVTVSAVSIVVFTVMSILIYILIAPIITLFCKIFLPFLRKKRNGLRIRYGALSKLLGLGCALVRFAILMMIFFVPLYGALEIGKVVVDEAAIVDEDMKELSVELDESVGSSVMLKLTSNIGKSKDGAFGLGAKTLGSRLLISTEYANINIVKELDKVGGYLPRGIELAFSMMDAEDTNEMVALIEEQDVITITDYLADSKVIKIVYPVAMNYLEANEEMLELDVDIDFKELANIDISKDLKNLQPFFISVLHCAQKLDLENLDIFEILKNKDVIEEALDAINVVLNLEITDKLVLKLATEYLNDALIENGFEYLVDLINNDYIKNKLITDIKSIYEAYLLLDNNGVIDYFVNEDTEEFEITDQLKNDLKSVIEIIFNLELIKEHEKKIVQTIFVFAEVEPEFYEGMFNENIDWSKEVSSVGEILLVAIETALSLDLDSLESEDMLGYLELLKSDELIEGISEILNIALTMQLSEKYVLPLAVEYVEGFLEDGELEEFKGIIDVEYIEYSLVNDLEQIVDAYLILEETKVLDYFLNEEEFEFTPEVKEKLRDAFNKIVELDLIEENEKTLVAYVLSFIPEEFEIDIESMLEENINWSNELHTLIDIVVDVFEFIIVCDFDMDEIDSMLQQEKFKELLPALIEKIFTLEISEKYIAPFIISKVSELVSEIGFEQFADYITVEYLKDGFSEDIVDILDLMDLFAELGMEDILGGDTDVAIDTSNEETTDKFRTAISTLLHLNILDGHQGELIMMLCDSCGLSEFISYDEEMFKDINWDEETDNFIDVLMAILNVTNIGSLDENILDSDNLDETSEQLGDLFDALINCSFTKDFAFDLVNNLIGSIGYEIELSETDKALIEQNTGKKEFKVLVNVAKEVLDLMPEDENGNTDYTILKGSDITDLMVTASEGVIASKIMGTVLNEMLGESGLDIMPKDPNTGENLYDFTDQDTLKEQAINIGNCIDLVNNLQTFDPDNIDSITNIASSLEALGSLEGEDNIVEDLLTEFLPTDSVEITESVNWSEEASVVEDVLNLYKESENKDDFTLEDEELLDRVEESEFAEIILDYLGIFG